MLWSCTGRETEGGKLITGGRVIAENDRCYVQSIVGVTCGVVQANEGGRRTTVGGHCGRLHLFKDISGPREITSAGQVTE